MPKPARAPILPFGSLSEVPGGRHVALPRYCMAVGRNVPGGRICGAAQAALLDHLVGEGEQRGRHFEAERPAAASLLSPKYLATTTRRPRRAGHAAIRFIRSQIK